MHSVFGIEKVHYAKSTVADVMCLRFESRQREKRSTTQCHVEVVGNSFPFRCPWPLVMILFSHFGNYIWKWMGIRKYIFIVFCFFFVSGLIHSIWLRSVRSDKKSTPHLSNLCQKFGGTKQITYEDADAHRTKPKTFRASRQFGIYCTCIHFVLCIQQTKLKRVSPESML